jgi:L-tartrate/succinate antiporter
MKKVNIEAMKMADRRKMLLRALIPLILGAIIVSIPPPSGLQMNAWLYFALFVAVITGVITEPIPAAAVGLIGVIVAAVAGLVYQNPSDAIKWALGGFSNSTVWLIFAAYMFAVAYIKTGLGKRMALLFIKALGKRTLGLGYAVAFADLVLAPFTPSNTARSGGTIYPIIVNIPIPWCNPKSLACNHVNFWVRLFNPLQAGKDSYIHQVSERCGWPQFREFR